MAEFETIPELTRVLTASHATISAGSKNLLQITDKLHFEAQIPLVYMGRCELTLVYVLRAYACTFGIFRPIWFHDLSYTIVCNNRYKDSFHAVQKERTRVMEELHAAQQAELFAQQHVDLASQTHSAAGGSSVGSNGHRAHTNGASNNGHASNGSAASAPATTISTLPAATPAGSTASTTSTTSPTQSQAEQRAAAAEQAYNQAKLDLAAAEDTYETKRAVAEEVAVTVRAEAARLESLERAQLVVSFYAIAYIYVYDIGLNIPYRTCIILSQLTEMRQGVCICATRGSAQQHKILGRSQGRPECIGTSLILLFLLANAYDFCNAFHRCIGIVQGLLCVTVLRVVPN